MTSPTRHSPRAGEEKTAPNKRKTRRAGHKNDLRTKNNGINKRRSKSDRLRKIVRLQACINTRAVDTIHDKKAARERLAGGVTMKWRICAVRLYHFHRFIVDAE